MNTMLNIKPKLKVVVPKQWNNDRIGKFWEKITASLFSEFHWEVITNIEFEGMQTDIYIKELMSGKRGLVECKFQEDNISPRIIHQLMGQAEDEEVEYAYLISTSELTPKAKAVMEKHKKKTQK
ncbi:restriction endonuclease [Dolichospermum sp. UHCC 0352]|uniref:restriction endonuclease n=1 Tax=Dolichospermum sp. UHCC 0352 TaxID=2590011 RepID=UPI001447A171|nr:restriction endonuclease [Dolichospermum sp. UHCC 0352]MTJ24019.1 restriction endonuclease [Dolichospermum sp. UHCC 0352]